MNKRSKQSVLILATTLGLGTMLAPLSMSPEIYAQEERADENADERTGRITERQIALGSTLDEVQKQETLDLLRTGELSEQQILSIDGSLINQYLADGSTKDTQVYSSVLIEPREEGYGVQVQIVTPNTVNSVAATAYQQAAITAGIQDVLIKVASVETVSGEGALAGVYAIYEINDLALNSQAIEVAQSEIELMSGLEATTELTFGQLSQLQTHLKTKVTEAFQADEAPNEATLNELTLARLEAVSGEFDIKLTQETATRLMGFVTDYAETETAKSEETIAQLEASTGLSWTVEQAIDLWEATFIDGPSGELANLDGYDRSQWQEVENQEAVIVLSQADNQGGNDVFSFEKTIEDILLTRFDGEAAYPDTPSVSYRIAGSTFEILEDSSAPVEEKETVEETSDNDEASESEEEEVGQAQWDANKSAQLAEFMANWGEDMGQTYQSFTPDSPGDMYGVAFPTDVIPVLGVNEAQVLAKWSPTGDATQAGDYAIVAAYNDAVHFFETNPNAPSGANFYLFAMLDGQPIVLNSQQNQGMPDGLIHFAPTENMELQAGFESIAYQ